MFKLGDFKGFIAVDSELGTATIFVGANAQTELLAIADDLSANTKIFGIHKSERELFGDTDVTELVAQRAAEEYIEDNAWQLDDPDWSESACAFISAHAQDHLDTEISTARSGANAHKSEMRSLRSTYQSNVL